jgi:hypothetical protein
VNHGHGLKSMMAENEKKFLYDATVLCTGIGLNSFVTIVPKTIKSVTNLRGVENWQKKGRSKKKLF